MSREPREEIQFDPESRSEKNAETETQIKTLQIMLEEKDKRIRKMVSDLKDARKEIKTVTTKKLELMLKLQNCQKAEENNKKLVKYMEEKKNEATPEQLEVKGKIFY